MSYGLCTVDLPVKSSSVLGPGVGYNKNYACCLCNPVSLVMLMHPPVINHGNGTEFLRDVPKLGSMLHLATIGHSIALDLFQVPEISKNE